MKTHYNNLFRQYLTLGFILMSTLIGYAQNLQISGGNNFSSVVCNQQQVNVTGYNGGGQLGVDAAGVPIAAMFRSSWAAVTMGNLTTVPANTATSLMPAIKQADAGSGGHLLGLDCAKNVWAWGQNEAGQLGRNNSGGLVSNAVPMRVLKGAQVIAGNFLGNVFTVSGGNSSSFAVEIGTGKVLAWGANDNGQLGDGSIINRLTPVYVLTAPGTPLTNIVQIEGGDACTYALDASGQVWSWGITHDNATPTSYVAYNLGRARTTEVVSAAGGAGRCIPYAGKVERGGPDNNTAASVGFLNNMVSLSGGDAHGIAIDASGQCWTWGGDWGTGQLGQGNGGQYNDHAGHVVDIGVIATTGPFLGASPTNTYKAIFTAAGQASCAIVLQDTTDPTNLTKNRVVAFGSNGMYETNGLITQAGTGTCTGNNQYPSGTLGRGICNISTCTGQAAQNADNNTVGYEYPVFVEINATTPLSGVTTVSDGDAWYFATDDVGLNAYSWGFNRRGEQADGTFNDRCYAAALTLPTSCSFDYPCPGQPILPANFTTCPIFSQILNSQVPQTYTSYQYNWQYRSTPGSGTWTDVLGTSTGAYQRTVVTSTDSVTKLVAQTGEWRVLVSDNRASVSFLCGACPVLADSVTITQVANPYTTSGCTGVTTSDYSVTAPSTAKIKWYTTYTGGTPLNPSDSNTTITYANASAPLTAACGPGTRALFAQDVGSVNGFLLPTGQLTPTLAQIKSAVGCATLSTNAGNQTYLAVQVQKNVTLTSISVYLNNTTVNPISIAAGKVHIFTNSPTSYWNGSYNVDKYSATEVAGSPVTFTATVPGSSAQVKSIALSVNLTPGIYWIQVDGDYNLQQYFSCNPAVQGAYPGRWTTPVLDQATGNNTISAIAAISPGSSSGYSSVGSVFDIKFQTGTGYACGRILVCQASGACPLPVSLLYFDAKKDGNQVDVNWATASEYNSDYFVVKRSADGINWTAIGKVKSAGNSKSVTNYSFIDTAPLSGVSYYTMDQYDFDGTASNTDVVTVQGEFSANVSIYPNPNNGQFNVKVRLAGENSEFTLKLVNAIGQTVFESNESTEGDTFSKDFNFGNLAKGVYQIILKTQKDNIIKKMILE